MSFTYAVFAIIKYAITKELDGWIFDVKDFEHPSSFIFKFLFFSVCIIALVFLQAKEEKAKSNKES